MFFQVVHLNMYLDQVALIQGLDSAVHTTLTVKKHRIVFARTMAPPPVPPGGAGEAGPAQQQQGGGGFLQKILTYILIYFVAQQFIGPRKPTDPAQLTSNLFSKGEKVVRLTLV